MQNTLLTLPNNSNGYAALTFKCLECKSAWRFIRTLGTVLGPPQYCIFCGVKGKVGLFFSEEETYDEVMANSYGLSVNRFRKIYKVWSLIGDSSVRLTDFIEKVKEADGKKKLG